MRERTLSVLFDAALIVLIVDVPALAVLVLIFFFGRSGALVPAGWAFFALTLVLFLLRDTTGGLSRKWLGYKIERAGVGHPGGLRSILRNLPLLVPGWNVYEAARVLRDGGAPLSLDGVLKLRRSEVP